MHQPLMQKPLLPQPPEQQSLWLVQAALDGWHSIRMHSPALPQNSGEQQSPLEAQDSETVPQISGSGSVPASGSGSLPVSAPGSVPASGPGSLPASGPGLGSGSGSGSGVRSGQESPTTLMRRSKW